MSNLDESSPGSGKTSSSPIVPPRSFESRLWALAVAAGFATGIVAWGIGEALLVPEAGFQSRNEKTYVSPSIAGFRNGSISFGALGAAMGFGFGVAGGLSRRSIPRAIIAGVTGLFMGGGTGVALTRLVLPIYYEHSGSSDITYPLIIHGGIWAGVAAVAGVAFAIGRAGWRGVPRGILGAIAGALIATVIYDFAGGIFFPLASTDRPISQTWGTRLLARLLVTILVASGVVLCAGPTDGVAAADPSRREA
jgi:hypothetical protein